MELESSFVESEVIFRRIRSKTEGGREGDVPSLPLTFSIFTGAGLGSQFLEKPAVPETPN